MQDGQLKDLILGLVKQRIGDNGDEIKEVELTDKTDSNLTVASQRKNAVVKFTSKTNSSSSDLNLFLKVCSKQDKTAWALNEKFGLFDKEAKFYGEILPALLTFEKEHRRKECGLESLASFMVNYIGTGTIGEDKYIVLERFNQDEFKVDPPRYFQSVEKLHRVFETLSIFHATVFCMKHKLNLHNNFAKEYPAALEEKVFHPENFKLTASFFSSMYKANLKVVKAVLGEAHKDTKDTVLFNEYCYSDIKITDNTMNRLEKYGDGIAMKALYKLQDCQDRFKVIVHGDFHIFNMAFDVVTATKSSPVRMKYFDFQAIRYATFMIDVQQHLAQACTPNTRNNFLKEILETYRTGFDKVCESYGMKDQSLTVDEFKDEYLRTTPWQFIYGFCWLFKRYVKTDFYAKLATITDDGDDDEAIMKLLHEQDKAVWNVVKIYLDMIVEAEKSNVLDRIEAMGRED